VSADEERKNLPVAQLQYIKEGSVGLSGGAGSGRLELDSHVVSLRASYGHRFATSGTIAMATARYDLTLSGSRLDSAPWYEAIYHFPALEGAVLQDLVGPLGLVVFGVGGVASDMAGFGARDIRYTVGTGGSYAVIPGLKLVVGAMVTNMFDGSLPVYPVVDLIYRRGNINFRAGFPYGMSAWLSVNPSVDLGLLVNKLSLRYSLYAGSRVADEYSSLSVSLGPAVRVFLWKGFYLQGEGGYDIRHLKLSRAGQITYETVSFEGWYVSSSLGYML